MSGEVLALGGNNSPGNSTTLKFLGINEVFALHLFLLCMPRMEMKAFFAHVE